MGERRRRSHGHPSFAAVWAPNPGALGWNCDGVLDSQALGQQRFDAESAAWCRPSLITLNQDGRYLQLFENNQIGEWYAQSGLDAAGEVPVELERRNIAGAVGAGSAGLASIVPAGTAARCFAVALVSRPVGRVESACSCGKMRRRGEGRA